MQNTEQNSELNYDAIIIGSGIGSLTVAALLSKWRKMRVLILEQHFTVGGQTHMFHRKGKFEFDVGIHYIGGMDRGMVKSIFDFITDGKVTWQKMPEDFETFSYPGFQFKVPSHKAEYKKRLIERFPEESAAIEKYFRDVKTAGKWYTMALVEETLPRLTQPIFKKVFQHKGHLASMTTGQYLDQNFTDPKLKALLVSQWGDYGVPPRESAFGVHCLVVSHYWRGAWYPVGGAKSIAQAIVPIIERQGGKVLIRKTVSEILIKGNKAYGVRAYSSLHPEKESEDYFAPLVISGAGAVNTYLKMIPPQVNIPFRDHLRSIKGLSAICIYLGLKDSPEKLGIKGENHWIFDSVKHDDAEDENGIFKGCYLSFPSLKNPQSKGHTADIITLMRYDSFSRWKEGKWKKRGKEYEDFKAEISQKLISRVNQEVPGLSELIEVMDISTPLTMEHFLKCDQGLFYGLPVTPGRLFTPWTRAKTPVKNLYLTGSDVMTPGVVGAMMGGIKTVGVLSGMLGYFRVMKWIKTTPL